MYIIIYIYNTAKQNLIFLDYSDYIKKRMLKL